MSLRLDAGTARDIIAGHHRASDALTTVGSPPSVDAAEADGQVARLLEALQRVGDNIARVNDIVAVHVQGATDNIESTDLATAQELAVAKKDLP